MGTKPILSNRLKNVFNYIRKKNENYNVLDSLQ